MCIRDSPVTVVHADRRLDTWPLREELTELVGKLPNARLVSFIEGEGGDYTCLLYTSRCV